MSGKQFNRRDFLRLAAVGAMSTAIAACTPEVVKETVEVTKEVEKVVKETVEVQMLNLAPHDLPYRIRRIADGKAVTIVRWSQDAYVENWENWHAEYSRYNPNVSFERNALASEAYTLRLQEAVAAGSGGPTLVGADYASNDHTARPYCQPYPEDIFPSEYMKKEWPQLWENSYCVDGEGKMWAWGQGYMTYTLYYTKGILEAEGVSEADIPRDWEGLKDLAKGLTVDANGRHPQDSGFDEATVDRVGWGANGREYYIIDMWKMQAGEFRYLPTHGGWAINTEAVYDCMKWFLDLYDSNAAVRGMPRGDDTFKSGKAAFAITQGHFANNLKDFPDLNFGTLPVPTMGGTDKPPMASPGGIRIGETVSNLVSAEEQEAGWDLLKFVMGSGEKVLEFMPTYQLFPLRADLQGDPRIAKLPGTITQRTFRERCWVAHGFEPPTDVSAYKGVPQEVIHDGKDLCETMAYYQKLVDEQAGAFTGKTAKWGWEAEREYVHADEMHEPVLLTDCPPK